MVDKLDKFGIKMIYPTRAGAREWFIKESPDDVMGDHRLGGDFEDDISGGNNTDGFTVGDNDQVRLHVCPETDLPGKSNPDLDQSTAKGRGYAFTSRDWDMKGIEATARIKCTDYDTQDSRFIIKGPSGSHKSNTKDCSGSSYMVRFFLAPSGSESGSYQWSKEQWHVHYVNRGSITKHNMGSIFNKWVVCKYIIYLQKSTDGTQNWVKIEAWLNTNNDGITFKKIGQTVDSGGWGTSADDCDADRGDEIMTWDNINLTFRWDGPKILFKDLSVREVDPLGNVPEPTPDPTTGTVARDWILKNNINSFSIDECNLGQDVSTMNKFYDVESSGSASNLHKERYRVGVVANGSNSYVIGKKPKRVVILLSKTGNPPSGDITCVMRKGSDDEVAVTYAHVGGALNATSLTTSPVAHTFENLTSIYAWQNGDRLLVEYSGNTVDVTNEVNVYRDTDNPVDGAYTCAIKFDSGGIPPVAYSAPDVSRDYAWEISE